MFTLTENTDASMLQKPDCLIRSFARTCWSQLGPAEKARHSDEEQDGQDVEGYFPVEGP